MSKRGKGRTWVKNSEKKSQARRNQKIKKLNDKVDSSNQNIRNLFFQLFTPRFVLFLIFMALMIFAIIR